MPEPSAALPIRSFFAEGQSASLNVLFGKTGKIVMKLSVTPAGVVAVGTMVSAILLSVVPVVWASTRARQARAARCAAAPVSQS